MKERPILFSGSMVRAILAGHKTQTRRVIRWNDDGPCADCGPCPYGEPADRLWVRETWRPWIRGFSSHVQYRADGRRGDSLGADASDAAMVLAEKNGGMWDDGRAQDPASVNWRPSIFMPRWACRLALSVCGVRAERLQSISEADAIAEGIPRNHVGPDADFDAKEHGWLTPAGLANWESGHDCNEDGCVGGKPAFTFSAVEAYQLLWDSINGKRPDCAWSDNPWVWVVEFDRATR